VHYDEVGVLENNDPEVVFPNHGNSSEVKSVQGFQRHDLAANLATAE
jgi:hypothetical protein